MKDKSSILNFSVNYSLFLLLSAAILVVFGIFDASLGWDIFSPAIEKLLLALFWSFISLAAVGVAMVLVLSAYEVVRTLQTLQLSLIGEKIPAQSIGLAGLSRRALAAGLAVICALGLLWCGHVYREGRRLQIFHRLAEQQALILSKRISAELASMRQTPENNIPRELHDILWSLDRLEFVDRATLYLTDRQDPHAMWGMTAWRTYNSEDGFSRFYISRPFEEIMHASMEEGSAQFDSLHIRSQLEHYFLIKDSRGNGQAVLRIDGNQFEDLLSYDSISDAH